MTLKRVREGGSSGLCFILGARLAVRLAARLAPIDKEHSPQSLFLCMYRCAPHFAAEDSDFDYDNEMAWQGRVYTRACEELGIVPAKYFLAHATDAHLAMDHHGIGSKGAEALATALLVGGGVRGLRVRCIFWLVLVF